MPIIDVTIGQRQYELSCDDGEQTHIRTLSKQVSVRLKALEEALGRTSENKLLAIACLMLEDELRSDLPPEAPSTQNVALNETVSEEELVEKQRILLEPLVLQLEALAKKAKAL
jgi:cell division protein ZapA